MSSINYFTPAQIDKIIDYLAFARIKADLELVPKYPYFSGKPFPLGRCCEIRDAVYQLIISDIKSNHSHEGLSLLINYMKQGHSLNKIWGGLRNAYFQNAFQIGDYYLDVSNDTVNPNKPRIEILPMAESGFAEITDFETFVDIGQRYWQVQMYKNSVCASLAPYMPILCVEPNGQSWLAVNDYTIAFSRQSQFEKAKQILQKLPEPSQSIKSRWQALLTQNSNRYLNNQLSPEAYCNKYKADGLDKDENFRNDIVKAFISLKKIV
ncbi:hypothetical protein DS2_13234 [Catenovulum agarivorans DS-2]|uniref:Uncharacterized protein n=1 Tax=Catenovulum agarivorans DS-2 TaxID=1328313 RepID=W7QN88_9ALTE|nr:hypothetical protein [Catenovulum agarivorans]EWH09363.1 hypothetical protein DS2_13234 [Catenovulum agarivorans DS-2]